MAGEPYDPEVRCIVFALSALLIFSQNSFFLFFLYRPVHHLAARRCTFRFFFFFLTLRPTTGPFLMPNYWDLCVWCPFVGIIKYAQSLGNRLRNLRNEEVHFLFSLFFSNIAPNYWAFSHVQLLGFVSLHICGLCPYNGIITCVIHMVCPKFGMIEFV